MHKPFWVEFGLLGIKTRVGAMAWLISSIVISVLTFLLTTVVMTTYLESTLLVSLVLGFMLGGLFSMASVWYWLSIRWMDMNGGWMPEHRERVYDYRSRVR
jgi:glycerol-3-phosphate acyltransferase PlsY